MRMLNMDTKKPVKLLQLYLTPSEARQFCKELDLLLADPEANEHSHICAEDMTCELSFSIVTEKKLENIRSYTKLEQEILRDNK